MTFSSQHIFRGKNSFVREVKGAWWILDRKVKWKSTTDWKVVQYKVIADREKMHDLTGAAWSRMWQRESVGDSEADWEMAFAELHHIRDFSCMQFQKLDAVEWKRHAATVPRKSARGSCAYTPRELLLMPTALVSWLLDMIDAIEHGVFLWPRELMVARVVMLAKSAEQPTCPLKIRPITITSRLYRNWSQISVNADYSTCPSVHSSTCCGLCCGDWFGYACCYDHAGSGESFAVFYTPFRPHSGPYQMLQPYSSDTCDCCHETYGYPSSVFGCFAGDVFSA